jgi:CRP/FNR family transcriptional regulator, cyclic AMP receptor protein
MISPELLRRYPFFGTLHDEQLRQVAMIAEEETYDQGKILLKEKAPADDLYLLIKGSVDLLFTVDEEYHPDRHKEFIVGEINPGELFGISALIEPHRYTSMARAASPVQVIHIDGGALRKRCADDPSLACHLFAQVAKLALERLNATRVQLAAARA